MKKQEFKKGDLVRSTNDGIEFEVISKRGSGFFVKNNTDVAWIDSDGLELIERKPSINTFKSSHREGVEL